MKKERKERVVHSVDKLIIKENVANSNYSEKEKRTLEILSNRLNEELEIQNIKQEELAKDIGISTGALSNYRTGNRFPETRILVAISKKLNVSLDYLFGITNLKSKDIELKKVNEITGLSDDAIKNLKEYVNFINDKNSLSPIKNIIENKLKAINYLIAQEEESSIFSTIASFLWYDYEANYENILYKNVDKEKIYKPDLEEQKNIYGNTILLEVKNQDITRGFKIEDINKLDFILIEEKLSELKNKYNKEKNN